MMRFLALLGVGGLIAFASAASAGMPVQQRMTCPIDGQEFNFTTTASYSTWGSRPDGKTFGSWEFPLALPVCPRNGLVIYREFKDEDVARLRPLVESAEYRALAGEATYYRAYWLMSRMDERLPNTLWALVQAGWQVDHDPARRRRYLEELVARSPELGEARDDVGLAMRARVINALRELGRFDEAAAMIASTDVEGIARPSEEVRSIADWRGHYRNLTRLVERRDSSIEPVQMIPWRVAQPRCEAGQGLSEHDRADCVRIAAEVAEARAQREAARAAAAAPTTAPVPAPAPPAPAPAGN